MKKRLSFLLTIIVVLLLVVGCATKTTPPVDEPADNGNDNEEPVAVAEYVGSESCKGCHSSNYQGWSKTQHGYMIQGPEALLPEARAALEEALANGEEDFLRIGADGEVITSLDQISLVNGGFFKQRFVINTDEGHRFLTAQYNIPSGDLTSYVSGSNWEDNCLGCHSTGLDLEKVQTLDRSASDYSLMSVVSEFGIGCEACHGAGSLHLADVRNPDYIISPADFTIEEQTHFCGSCHARATGHVELAGRNDPIGFNIGDNIFDFTKVLSPGTNQNVWVDEQGFWDRAEGGNRRFHPDGGARSHRMQFNDMIQGPHWGKVSCTDCHDMHAAPTVHTQTGAPSTLRWEFADFCAECHGNTYDPEEYMPVRANSSNIQDQRNHTFLPGGVGNPDPNVPERE